MKSNAGMAGRRGSVCSAVMSIWFLVGAAPMARGAQPARRLTTKFAEVTTLSFSRDGKRLCAASVRDDHFSGSPNVLQWWRTSDWKLAHSIPVPDSHKFLTVSSQVGFVAATGLYHSSRFGRDAWLWDASSGKQRRTFPGAEAVTFSPDGRLISVVQSAFDESWSTKAPDVRLLDARTLRVIRSFNLSPPRGLYFYGYDSSASGQASGVEWELSPDGRFLAVPLKARSRRPDKYITDFGGALLLDLYSNARPRLLPAPSHRRDLRYEWKFSPDGRLLLVGTRPFGWLRGDKLQEEKWQMRFLQTRSGRVQHSWLLPSDETVGAFSPDGTSLLCFKDADYGHRVMRLREARSGRLRFAFEGVVGNDGTLAFSPDGALLAGSGYDGGDGRLLLWNARTGRFKARLPGKDKPVTAAAFSPDGATLASANRGDGTVKIWRLPEMASPGQRPGGSAAK